MSNFMRCALLSVLVFAQVSSATSIVYFNEAQWQAAVNSPSDVSFASSNWTESLQLTPIYTELVSQSSNITVDSGYGEPGLQDNSTLGHVSNGVWSDSIGKYGSTTFNFADPVLAFGGNFDIARNTGLDFVLADGSAFGTPNGSYDGFIGVVSDQPLASVLISYGQNDGPQSFGNSYTLSNLQLAVAAVATPEPNLDYVFCALLVMIAGRFILKRN